MSKGINKWHGVGNLCADPEARYTPAGAMIVNITVACNDGYKDKNTGQAVDTTEFVKVVFFNKLAEIVNQYARKGSKVYVEGQLRTRSWEQDGQKKYMTEIVASEMQLLDSRQGGSAGAQTNDAPPRPINHNAQRPAQQQNDYRGHSGSNQPNPTYGNQQPQQSARQQPAQAQPPRSGAYDAFDDDIPFANPYKNMEFMV